MGGLFGSGRNLGFKRGKQLLLDGRLSPGLSEMQGNREEGEMGVGAMGVGARWGSARTKQLGRRLKK